MSGVDAIFDWVTEHLNAIPPPTNEAEALASAMRRAAIWEGAARRLAKLADLREKQVLDK